MINLGKSDKMIKVSVKGDKPKTYNCLVIFRSLF